MDNQQDINQLLDSIQSKIDKISDQHRVYKESLAIAADTANRARMYIKDLEETLFVLSKLLGIPRNADAIISEVKRLKGIN